MNLLQLRDVSRGISERIADAGAVPILREAGQLSCTDDDIRAFLYRLRERFVVETFHEENARSGYQATPPWGRQVDRKTNRDGVLEKFRNERDEETTIDAGHASSRPPNFKKITRKTAVRVLYEETGRFFTKATNEDFEPSFLTPRAERKDQDYEPKNRAARFFRAVLDIVEPWREGDMLSLEERAASIVEMVREDRKNRRRSRSPKLPHGSK